MAFFRLRDWGVKGLTILRDRPNVSPVWALGAKARSDALERHVQDTCQRLRFPTDGVHRAMERMYYDDTRKVIYCFVPKAGSPDTDASVKPDAESRLTAEPDWGRGSCCDPNLYSLCVASSSWKRVWLRMTGINDTTLDRYALHAFLPRLAANKDREEKLRTYKKFLMVRHPLERVLSAFRDKLETPDQHPAAVFQSQIDYFSKKIAGMIKAKYRGAAYRGGHNVTFAEFIRFISEAGRGTPEQRNEHWRPMHELCQPCAVRHDFIGKYENLKEDADYLLQWLGLTDLVDGFPASDRTFHASRLDSKYLGQLSHSDIMAFHAKHQADFLLFDYMSLHM
ncbi:carbohydrate sulfotransferase 13-like [Eriocheir sinensis]|uniref:carbohydrate sulfotransferase 13-like n=1 Tax=Eriocheir sinensis TaxID=95602 RepID=UPI0021C6F874|nr:carbohydrate sulfotransferase 13-like [Eriocheir sinensis]